MPTEILTCDLITHSQAVKKIFYSELMDQKIDINDCELDYSILKHDLMDRHFKIQLFMNINILEIIVEGHYEVSKRIDTENYCKVVETIGLRTLIPFLRHSVLSISNLTTQGALHLPLVNIENLVHAQTKATKLRKAKISHDS